MMISKPLMATAVAGLSLLSLSAIVWASTTINTPGAACVATSGGSLNVRVDGEIENLGGATVTAVCPAERPIGTGGTTLVAGTVFVIDRNPSTNVCCRVVSKNAAGNLVQSAQVCSTGSATTTQSLALPQISDPFSFSSYMVTCDVPAASAGAASRIQMYRTTQD